MAEASKPDPSTKSAAMQAMSAEIARVDAILGGQDAIKRGAEAFLPKLTNETQVDYADRLQIAKFTNIFRDIVEGLASRPFQKDVTLDDAAPQSIKDFVENVDGRGNNLSVFAAARFFAGIAYGFDWILVDFPPAPSALTRADERALSLRPYWVPVSATAVISVRSARYGGEEFLTEFRFWEGRTEEHGFTEKNIDRIRVLKREKLETGQYGPATYEVWEKTALATNVAAEWLKVEEGPILIGGKPADRIPAVPFIPSRDRDAKFGVHPPMRDAATLQITHYQQESDLEYSRKMTCFPVLAGNGVTPPKDAAGNALPIQYGPKAVLFAPPDPMGKSQPSWEMIEPGAQSLTFCASRVDATERQLRDLGRQPLTAQSANMTTVAAAKSAEKGNTAIQAWAVMLEDALENALAFTAKYLGEPVEPEVEVYKDFTIDPSETVQTDALLSMRKNGDISQRTLWDEMRRRKVLSDRFDPDDEEEAILNEIPGDTPPDETTAALPPPGDQQAA